VAERRLEPGPVVERALESLRQLPPVDGEALGRIVAAAARTRAVDAEPNEDDLLPTGVVEGGRRRAPVVIAAAAVVALALGGTELWHLTRPAGVTPQLTRVVSPAPGAPTAAVAAFAAREGAADAAPIPTQFVFDGRARRVVLVGDFNNWDERAAPLEREPGSSLWSVTVPIPRGRHIYAFLVDSVWTVDKRAPVARDPDFGVTGSVVLVGRP
jgi:hypothetical protein